MAKKGKKELEAQMAELRKAAAEAQPQQTNPQVENDVLTLLGGVDLESIDVSETIARLEAKWAPWLEPGKEAVVLYEQAAAEKSQMASWDTEAEKATDEIKAVCGQLAKLNNAWSLAFSAMMSACWARVPVASRVAGWSDETDQRARQDIRDAARQLVIAHCGDLPGKIAELEAEKAALIKQQEHARAESRLHEAAYYDLSRKAKEIRIQAGLFHPKGKEVVQSKA